MAEWSCSGLQLRERRFDSDSGLQNQICPGGEIGRHTRLKILRFNERTGSIPVPGTIYGAFFLPEIYQSTQSSSEMPF